MTLDTTSPLTSIEARQAYVHFLAQQFQRFLPYREWKTQENIEIKSTPYVKALIKATGYPGYSEIDDIYDWIADELWIIEQRINDVRNILVGVINYNFGVTVAGLSDVYSVLGNAIKTVTAIMQAIDRQITATILKVGDWIDDLLTTWGDIISGVINATAKWIEDIGYKITSEIDRSLKEVGNYLGDMYQQFAEAIESISSGGGSTFDAIGDIIIAAIKGSVALAVTIVESLAGVIVTTLESLERVLTHLIDGLVKTVDLLVTGVKDIIGGTINSLLDYLKWLWAQITALLDKMFDFNIENLTPLFVSLFEAQKEAFRILKDRAETVQP